MKIISKEDVSKWSYKHTCNDCDSVLEVEAGDLTHQYYGGDQREPAEDSYFAKCAVCKSSFSVPIKQIPKLVQIDVKNRSKAIATKNELERPKYNGGGWRQ